ncbi:hypothetical protein [Secundilactobacillus kimchicus]|uniref:hypothetical protein n=1 Tax=Secundilactobacillus kimchicus TaxID=528209 RepID=UPI0024A9F822|nr:hypothetical protein [Secundilactobacillus kimchicus]
MKAFALDDTGDLVLNESTGTFEMIEGEEAAQQKLFLVMNINSTELEWNENIGIDQLNLLLNGDDESVVAQLIDDYLSEQWPDTYIRSEITEFTVDRKHRTTSLTMNVYLTDGEVINAQSTILATDGGEDDASD